MFDAFFKGPKCVKQERMKVFYKFDSDVSCMAISVGRKFGHAVARNRIKRWLREIVRQHWNRVPVGVTMVFVPQMGILSRSFDEVAQMVVMSMRRMVL